MDSCPTDVYSRMAVTFGRVLLRRSLSLQVITLPLSVFLMIRVFLLALLQKQIGTVKQMTKLVSSSASSFPGSF